MERATFLGSISGLLPQFEPILSGATQRLVLGCSDSDAQALDAACPSSGSTSKGTDATFFEDVDTTFDCIVDTALDGTIYSASGERDQGCFRSVSTLLRRCQRTLARDPFE